MLSDLKFLVLHFLIYMLRYFLKSYNTVCREVLQDWNIVLGTYRVIQGKVS